jgi:expansin
MSRSLPLLALIHLLAGCGSSHGESPSGGAGGAGAAPAGSTAAGSTAAGSTAAGSTAAGSTAAGSTTAGPGATSGGGGATGSACESPLPEYANNDGSVTYYTFSMGSAAVNCSFAVLGESPDVVAHVATGNGQYFGAMDATDYASAAPCGACVEITRDGTRTVVVTIVDQCPGCQAGHIDLSEAAFMQLGDVSEGYLGTGNGGAVGLISWRYVACPVPGDVSYELKDPTNVYWNQILVEDHRYAIDKVEAMVSGQWAAAVRQTDNYWQVGTGSLGSAPYAIRVTDVNGDAIQAQLALAAGDQTSSAQFPLCQ